MDAKLAIDRAMNLREFEVQVSVPKTFCFTGVVPYDMEIVGGHAFVTVLAETIEEATEKATEFFNG